MKAYIAAGGKGERLQPLTGQIPKPMVEISGKPILLRIIEFFKKYSVSEFVISVGYKSEAITSFFQDGRKWDVRIDYVHEAEEKPLGSAGAICLAKKYLNDTFIVTYADILRELDLSDMIKFHKRNKSEATINVYKREGTDPKSTVIFDSFGKVLKFVERPEKKDIKENMVWANGSLYIFEKEILGIIPPDIYSDFGHDIFPQLLASKKRIYAYPSSGYLYDLGSLTKVRNAEKSGLFS